MDYYITNWLFPARATTTAEANGEKEVHYAPKFQ